MLADVGRGVTVTGLGKRVIDTKDTSFEAEITPDAGMELVKGPEGKRYLAAPKVEVSTGDHTVMPIRGYAFPGDLGGKTKGEYLAEPGTTGAPRWQEYALYGNMSAEGTYVKLIPQIVKADEGSPVVTIKAADGFVLSKPVRSGVAVSFQLLKSDSADGTFALFAENPIEPSFTVDVTAIGPKTFWKIQTVFSCEEEQP